MERFAAVWGPEVRFLADVRLADEVPGGFGLRGDFELRLDFELRFGEPDFCVGFWVPGADLWGFLVIASQAYRHRWTWWLINLGQPPPR